MPVSEEEEKSIRERVRKELEAKERERIEANEKAKRAKEEEEKKLQESEEQKRDDLRRLEIAEDEKKKFYKEKGFIPVWNSSGNLVWLSPEEYEAKKHRIKSHPKRMQKGKQEDVVKTQEEVTEIPEKTGASKLTKYIFVTLVAFLLISILLVVIVQFFKK